MLCYAILIDAFTLHPHPYCNPTPIVCNPLPPPANASFNRARAGDAVIAERDRVIRELEQGNDIHITRYILSFHIPP